MRFFQLGLILFLALSACGPQPSESNKYQKDEFYPQDFETAVAALVQERNGQPATLASAFLVERQAGFFATAKHFVEDLPGDEFKIFINGKVYRGAVVITPTISDLASVPISESF